MCSILWNKGIGLTLLLSLLISITLIVLGCGGSSSSNNSFTPFTGIMTPYNSDSDFEMNGAMLDLKSGLNYQTLLQKMKVDYHINTVNLYGLEDKNDADKNALFTALSNLGMKAVVRIEAYNSSDFAFQTSDLDWIFTKYTSLIQYVSDPSRRDCVAYFALNMPVDDPGVQGRLGGINSATSKSRQPAYAAAFVTRMKNLVNSYGFTTAKLYLSVFYGWDQSYQIPSYTGSGADGYFFNNYSYPAGDATPGEGSSDSELINQPRLQSAMDKFENQYSGYPQVIEYGFHTQEYNNWVKPNQTAGLVSTKTAKRRALKATTNFYKNKSDVKGTLYFGYNLFKEEGTPPALLDWALEY